MFGTALIGCLLLASPDAVHLIHEVTVSFEEDGTILESTHAVIIPLTGRGVQRFSEMSVAFREGMEDVEIERASVGHWRPGRGSSVAEVSTGPHRILSTATRLESSLREKTILMPGLEVGDTVKIDISRTIFSLPLSDVYSYSFSPVLRDSVLHSVFQVVNSSGVQLIADNPGSRWDFWNRSPAPSHPLAAYDPEYVSVATGTPEMLSDDASRSLDPPEYSDCPLLDEIVSQTGSDPAALRLWVAQHINYIGADTGIWPGWSPRSPAETLEEGSGVCRDRAILLVWLLRKAGFDAYPAFASTRGRTPPLVDARSFDHMFTVYRDHEGGSWKVLDPTPKGVPSGAGASFGLRGCSFLPIVPGGAGLEVIPADGWNDSLKIYLNGELDTDDSLITGTLHAESNGAPLELITTLYTQSPPEDRDDLFRRFFGAVSCDSVGFEGNELILTGEWKVQIGGGCMLLPGLREISLPGTRIASMLLSVAPDSFFVDAPATEVLDVSVAVDTAAAYQLPSDVHAPGYSCRMYVESGRLFYLETADIVNTNPDLPETLLWRSGTSARTVRLR